MQKHKIKHRRSLRLKKVPYSNFKFLHKLYKKSEMLTSVSNFVVLSLLFICIPWKWKAPNYIYYIFLCWQCRLLRHCWVKTQLSVPLIQKNRIYSDKPGFRFYGRIRKFTNTWSTCTGKLKWIMWKNYVKNRFIFVYPRRGGDRTHVPNTLMTTR